MGIKLPGFITPLTSCVTLGKVPEAPCLSFPTSSMQIITWE